MKQLIKFFAIFTCIALMACSNQEDCLPIEPQVKQSPNVVAEEIAERAANAFFLKHAVGDALVTKSPLVKGAIVKDHFTMTNNDGESMLHVFNYEGGGFVLVSADDRMDPILGYSEDGYFDEDPMTYPEGLKFWLDYIEASMVYLRTSDDETPAFQKGYWNQYTVETRAVKPPVSPCADLLDVLIGPLLTTSWNQESPFNALLPELSCGSNNHIYAGCVPIAIAQTMKYFRHPTSYSWNMMPSTGASQATQNLILDIYNAFNSAHQIVYNCSGTGVYDAYNLGTFMTNYFGYASATQTTYNYSTLQTQLITYNRPVVLTGWPSGTTIGHAWVCDGIRQLEECVVDPDGYERVIGYVDLLHMNWGWEASKNGFFVFNNWTVDGVTFSDNLKMLYMVP